MTKETARRRRAASLRNARRCFREALTETPAMAEWLEDRAFDSLEKARKFKAIEKAL